MTPVIRPPFPNPFRWPEVQRSQLSSRSPIWISSHFYDSCSFPLFADSQFKFIHEQTPNYVSHQDDVLKRSSQYICEEDGEFEYVLEVNDLWVNKVSKTVKDLKKNVYKQRNRKRWSKNRPNFSRTGI